MRSAVSPVGGWRYSVTGVSTATRASKRSICTKLSPWVRGIAGLTSAIAWRVTASTAGVRSTDTPRLTKPRASGGETWSIATSIGSLPLARSRGTSSRLIGT